MTLNEHDEVNRLLAQIRKLTQDISKIEDQTQKNYQNCDRYEKRLTKLTMANGGLERQAQELAENDKSELQTALNLIVQQTDAFAEEVKFMKRKNEKLEKEIADYDQESQQRIFKLESDIRNCAGDVEKERQCAAELEAQIQELESQIYDLKSSIEQEETKQRNMLEEKEELEELCQDRQQQVLKPKIDESNVIESLCQDLKEMSNDLIKVLVGAYENPGRFLERKNVYLDLLNRIERKKSEIVYLRGK